MSIIKRKRGRPKSENPRNRMVQVRLTEEEYQELLMKTKTTGESVSHLIRKLALNYAKIL